MHIVLVDKDNKSLARHEEILRKINPKDSILIFNDSYKALAYIKEHSVDEIYIEISMYDMTGFALTRKIKEINKRIKVVLMDSSKEYAIEAWKIHADYFLTKPIMLEDILQMRD